jgi:DNA-binding response OmpR family regulator
MPTVLVVDDEVVIQRLVTYTLKASQVEVLTAFTATEALELANQHCVDLFLIDVNLPDIDGFVLIEKLRSNSALANTPMITFTARNEPNDVAHAREVGATMFLYKPFSTMELREAVMRFVKV